MKYPKLFGIFAMPPTLIAWLLRIVPFVALICAYIIASDMRLEANPSDKLLPSLARMYETLVQYVATIDPRTGKYLLLADTTASMSRIATGISLAAVSGLMLGVNMGLFPGLRLLLNGVVTFLSIIPPLALLPILFVTVGTDEAAKVTLIYVGTVFVITRAVFQETEEIPRELIIKAFTLGATEFQIAYSIALPMVLPRLIGAVRLSLGGAWLFLIAAEAIAATEGLGYRIFLVRRYLAMDVIIPYVLWITFIGFSIDWVLRKFTAWKYPWYEQK